MIIHSKVLVTGGAGFIGSELVRQLVAAGASVTVLDNLSTGKRSNLAGIPSSACKLVEGDLRDSKLVLSLLPGISHLFHLACVGIRRSVHNPREAHEVNAGGTLTLLELARKMKLKRFVYVSSSEVFGNFLSYPLSETHPTFPTTVYGASKLAGEAYARAYSKTYGLPVVIVRPFNSFGPRCHHEGDAGEVIPRFLLRLMAGKELPVFGDGTQVRDFTFVEDTARGILLAAQCERAVGETIHLGSGKGLSILELGGAMAEILGIKTPQFHNYPHRPGDVQKLVANSNHAKKMLGWGPEVPFEEGLRRLAAWYASQGIAPETLLEEEILLNWESSDADSLNG